jgi:hypothetical protein
MTLSYPKEKIMDEDTCCVARVRYVHGVNDDFSQTAEHYIARIDGIEGEGKGRSPERAVRECGADVWKYNVQIVPVAWPVDVYDKWMASVHEEALNDNKKHDRDAACQKKRADRQGDLARHMATWNLQGEDVGIWVDYDGDIEVQDCGHYNRARCKYVNDIRRRKFKPHADGLYNWNKIQEAVEAVAAYKARETNERLSKATAEERSKAILTELGEEAKGWCADGRGGVYYTASAKTADEARAIKHALMDANQVTV